MTATIIRGCPDTEETGAAPATELLRQQFGRSPLAFARLKPGASVSAVKMVVHGKALLAGYKVPRELRFEETAKTATGKTPTFQMLERALKQRHRLRPGRTDRCAPNVS